MGRLDELDLSRSLSRKEEERALDQGWERLTQLRLTLGGLIGDQGLGPPLCVVFEGWDASGKGGAIKRLVAQMDPRHVRVVHAPSASDLGRAVGREQTAAVGIVDRQLAQGIRELMDLSPPARG